MAIRRRRRTLSGRQRRRLKYEPDTDGRIDPGPVSKQIALVMSALTVILVVAVVVLFSVGSLLDGRIAGVLLIPTVLLVVSDAFLWSRLFDVAHPVRHPIRFARSRRDARIAGPAAGAHALRMRRRHNL